MARTWFIPPDQTRFVSSHDFIRPKKMRMVRWSRLKFDWQTKLLLLLLLFPIRSESLICRCRWVKVKLWDHPSFFLTEEQINARHLNKFWTNHQTQLGERWVMGKKFRGDEERKRIIIIIDDSVNSIRLEDRSVERKKNKFNFFICCRSHTQASSFRGQWTSRSRLDYFFCWRKSRMSELTLNINWLEQKLFFYFWFSRSGVGECQWQSSLFFSHHQINFLHFHLSPEKPWTRFGDRHFDFLGLENQRWWWFKDGTDWLISTDWTFLGRDRSISQST